MKRVFPDYFATVFILLPVFCFFNAGFVFSEEVITSFNENFALNVFSKYNIGIFEQQQTVSYRTDKPFDIGLGVRYKNMSAKIFIPLSFSGNAFDLELNSYFEKFYFESFIKHYQNFYDDKKTEYNNAGLDILTTGITAGWIHNNQNHSLDSVYNLNRKQGMSNGSFIYGFGMFYTSIYSENNNIKHYDKRKHLVQFGPMAGYSYTWILPHDMFVNTGITVGTNLGINVTESAVLFIPVIKQKISFGHHNRGWSINAVMGCNATIILWNKNDFDILAPSTMMVTFSKRF
jgi:hypothetical protein